MLVHGGHGFKVLESVKMLEIKQGPFVINKDKIKFYYNARGSICEVQNFLFLSQDLKYLDKKEARKIFSEYELL